VVWVGVEALGDHDGRVALYLADHLHRLLPPALASELQPKDDGREARIIDYLGKHGATFFTALHEAIGAGYPRETVDALWNLVWTGVVTNDTFHALRAFTHVRAPRRRPKRHEAPAFRSRRLVPPSAEGRWSMVARPAVGPRDRDRSRSTAWAAAVAQQLLARHGVLTREAVAIETIPGGFGAVYPVLKALEESGRVRRGYFVAGLGATQFALAGAVDLLRSLRDGPDEPEVAVLAATDPANPYGATLKWPAKNGGAAADDPGRGPTRSVGATVILVDGALAAYLARGDRMLALFLPDAEPQQSKAGRAVARALIERARSGIDAPRGMLIEEIDGRPATLHPAAAYFVEAGFIRSAMGLQATFPRVALRESVTKVGSQ